jgi:hypothetical protein
VEGPSTDPGAVFYGRDRSWFERYVEPFYMSWMLDNALKPDREKLKLAQVRARAAELGVDDVVIMLGGHWRLQVMGAWYAIILDDPALSEAVHASFDICYGDLTAPPLCIAAITYRNDTTAAVLRAYHRRDVAHDLGAAGLMAAAIEHLEGPGGDLVAEPTDVDDLRQFLALADELRST